MSETLFLYLAFGITVPVLILLELLAWRNRAVKREIYDPWRLALEMKDYERAEFFHRVWRQADIDFIPFRCPPWRWFRYRNLLQGTPPTSERPYHTDQSIAEG